MKWLQDNPLGMVLAAIGGVFALLALGMAIIWTLPVTAETAEMETENTASNNTAVMAHKVASLDKFQVINERPVFNESRQPVIAEAADDLADDESIEVKGAPEVRLTGVIITSSMRIASLTATTGDKESVMAHEGQTLTGGFVGWQVSTVNPRSVVLESRDGQRMELELQVHDRTIKEPPKPVATAISAQARPGNGAKVAAENGQPPSRAEQIRQRIAQRREELRREQEEQQNQTSVRGGGTESRSSGYQSAIRSMMGNNSKDKSGENKKDG